VICYLEVPFKAGLTVFLRHFVILINIYCFFNFSEVKECVALLIQELEESKTGDKSFISNNSFSIQKLLRVLGEDSIAR